MTKSNATAEEHRRIADWMDEKIALQKADGVV